MTSPSSCVGYRTVDIPLSADHIRYYAGWADKITGKTIPVDDKFGKHLAYTYKEPLGESTILPVDTEANVVPKGK